jgi:phosphohistidine phosphatase
MKLYVIRHAIAVEAGDPKYEEDNQRPLTSKGKEKIKKIAQGLWELEIQLDLILSSPTVRTMETAAILAKRLDVKKSRIIPTEHLEATGYADQLINEINEKYAEAEEIALIGHEPYLSNLVSVLLTGDANISMTLKKGSVCKLSVDTLQYGRCANLDWLLSPAQLIHIGENA